MSKIQAIADSPFSEAQIVELHRSIDTPALLIHDYRLMQNLEQMQQLANRNKSVLRPHTKTHKSAELARRQVELGAAGITVAKLGEAEVMMAAGLTDIFVANQIVHPIKIKRLKKLSERGRIIIGLDHPQQIALLEPFFKNSSRPLEVRIEIDSGLQRCGIPVGPDLSDLAKRVKTKPWLALEGIFTHAGQAYQVSSLDDIRIAAQQEGQLMQQARDLLKKNGIEVPTVSVGSTPTVPLSVQNEAVNEIRPGNYIFYDATQLKLGSARPDRCSLFILATVVSQPGADRLIIDAGSKALHNDPLPAGNGQTVFGILPMLDGAIERLSEEHGIIKTDRAETVAIGSPLLVVPNHACVVANLFDRYNLISSDLAIREIPVSARGKSQ